MGFCNRNGKILIPWAILQISVIFLSFIVEGVEQKLLLMLSQLDSLNIDSFPFLLHIQVLVVFSLFIWPIHLLIFWKLENLILILYLLWDIVADLLWFLKYLLAHWHWREMIYNFLVLLKLIIQECYPRTLIQISIM